MYFVHDPDCLLWYDALKRYCIHHETAESYELGAKVGVGANSIVYKGKRLRDGKTVAIKKIKKAGLIKDSKKAEDVGREIDILRSLNHPNVLSLLDVYDTKDDLNLVSEYAMGGDVGQLLRKRGRISEDRALLLFRKVLFGLAHLHSKRVIHRDIKPANIFLEYICSPFGRSGSTGSNTIIADFGLSVQLDKPHSLATITCGTPGCMAPEVIKKLPYGMKADVYSAGVFLYGL